MFDLFRQLQLGREGADALMTPGQRITAQYDESGGYKLDPAMSLGGLATEGDRLKALSILTQTSGGDMDGRTACGGATLLGGALLANGTGGINTLLGAIEAMSKKNAGKLKDPKDLEEQKRMLAEVAELKKKLAKPGAEVTAGDLGMAMRDVYGLIAPGGQGTPDTAVRELFKSSPELRKMFKDNDLSYESIDHNGDGVGDHAVLGIGHHLGDRKNQGPHEMVWDPWKRMAPGQAAAHEEALEYGAQVKARTYNEDKNSPDYNPHPMYWEGTKQLPYPMAGTEVPQAAYEAALAKERGIREANPATQLISDEATLMDYWMARVKTVDTETKPTKR